MYKEESLERTKAFSIFYIGISLGSITGPMIYGLAYTYKLYWLAFLVSGIGLLSAILFLKKFKNIFTAAPNNYSFSKAALAITLSFFVSLFFIRYNELFGYFISAAAILGIILAVNFVKKMSSQEQVAISSLLIPIISNIIFLIALLQVYSSITLFIERHVNRQILFGWEIPASWFSTMEPFCILFMVPLLNALWKKLSNRGINLSSHQKVILGLLFACVGFVVVSLITKIVWTNSYVVLLLLFLVNMLLAAGELCIIPVTMSLISLKSPTNYRGTLMGIFYFSLTFSGYLSGLAAKLFPTNASSLPTDYMPLFITISAVLFITATLLTFLNKLMHRFIGQQTGNIFLSS